MDTLPRRIGRSLRGYLKTIPLCASSALPLTPSANFTAMASMGLAVCPPVRTASVDPSKASRVTGTGAATEAACNSLAVRTAASQMHASVVTFISESPHRPPTHQSGA